MTNLVPDRNCVSLPDGSCVAKGVCMHSDPATLSEAEIVTYDDLIDTHHQALLDEYEETTP